MTKEAKEMLEPLCARIVELKNEKERIEKELKAAEATVKAKMNEEHVLSDLIGKYTVEITKVAESRTVDTAKLKADGLYDKYSKPKAGYDVLKVIDPDDAQGSARRGRQAEHADKAMKKLD